MGRRRSTSLFLAFVGLACAAPVLVLVAALGTRAGVWSLNVGYDLLAQRAAFLLSLAGLAAAAGALLLAGRRRGSWPLAAVGATVALVTVGGFAWQKSREGPAEDVSTDLAEIPGFGPLESRRGAGGPAMTAGPAQCAGAVTVPTQSLPEAVVYVLQQQGFAVRRAGVTGVYGYRQSFWFGFPYDVAVRIRPRRTDIRVAARDGRPHGGEACRLVTRISAALREGS